MKLWIGRYSLFALVLSALLVLALKPTPPSSPLFRSPTKKRLDSLLNEGRFYSRLGRLEEATKDFRAAADLAEVEGDKVAEVRNLLELGTVYHRQGRLQEAGDVYDQALAIDAGSIAEVCDLHHAEGDLYLGVNKISDAIRHYKMALFLTPGENKKSKAYLCTLLSQAYRKLGLEVASRSFARVGDEFAVESGDAETKVYSRLVWIEAQRSIDAKGTPREERTQEEKRRIVEELEGQLREARRAGDLLGIGFALSSLAGAYFDCADYRVALKLIDEAIDDYSRAGVDQFTSQALHGKALTLMKLDRLSEALECIGKSIAIVEQMRSSSNSDDSRASYFEGQAGRSKVAVDILMRLAGDDQSSPYVAKAFAESERSKSRTLLESMADKQVDFSKIADSGLLAQEKALQEEVRRTAEELQAESTEKAQGREGKREKFILAIHRLEEVGHKIKRSSAVGSLWVAPDLKDLQRMLGEDEVVLSYSLGVRSWLWVIGRHYIRPFALGDQAPIEAAAKRVISLIGVPEEDREGGDLYAATVQLSRLVLEPAANELLGKRLAIVPEGSLALVSFPSLLDPSDLACSSRSAPTNWLHCRRLGFGHTLTVLPSAFVVKAIRRRSAGRNKPAKLLAAMGNPVFNRDPIDNLSKFGVTGGKSKRPRVDATRGLQLNALRNLPETQAEVDSALALVPRDKRWSATGYDATRENFLNLDFKQYQVIYLATHGGANIKDPQLSEIVFSMLDRKGKALKGWVQGYEIQRLDIPVDLVILSACETGSGRVVEGEGVMSLTRSFINAGASSVLVSLWNVDDKATAVLMKNFTHGLFLEGLRPAEALRKAQMAVSEIPGWRDPYFWAGFELQGDWK